MQTNQQDMQVSQPVEKLLIKCRKEKESTLACFNEDCKLYPFVCSQKDCECQKDHEDCSMLVTDKLEKAVRKKIVTFKPLEQTIEVYFNQVIDKLSNCRDELLQKLQKQFRNYFGLSDLEMEFLKFLDTGNNADLIGNNFWSIQSHLKDKSQTVLSLNDKFEKIQRMLNIFESQVEEFTLHLPNKIRKLQKSIFTNSKIIRRINQQQIIEDFFEKKKIKSANLLYRASENNFQHQIFFENCKGIQNTIMICETEYGKIIGAYSRQDWKDDNTWYADMSDQTFIFSVTHNAKFSSLKGCGVMLVSQLQSFRFGSNCDLFISNKSNQKNCKASINNVFVNQNYTKDNSNSHQRFSGSRTNQFKLKEFQIFQIQFEY